MKPEEGNENKKMGKGMSVAKVVEHPDHNRKLNKLFARFDRNGDGSLSAKEFLVVADRVLEFLMKAYPTMLVSEMMESEAYNCDWVDIYPTVRCPFYFIQLLLHLFA